MNLLVRTVCFRPSENTSERVFRVTQESWFQHPVVIEPQGAPRLQQIEPSIQPNEDCHIVIDHCSFNGFQDPQKRTWGLLRFSTRSGLGQQLCEKVAVPRSDRKPSCWRDFSDLFQVHKALVYCLQSRARTRFLDLDFQVVQNVLFDCREGDLMRSGEPGKETAKNVSPVAKRA